MFCWLSIVDGASGAHSCLHELLLGAFRADDVFGIGDEASTHQRCLASGADEAIVVPMAVLERDESSAADSCERHEKIRNINKYF